MAQIKNHFEISVFFTKMGSWDLGGQSGPVGSQTRYPGGKIMCHEPICPWHAWAFSPGEMNQNQHSNINVYLLRCIVYLYELRIRYKKILLWAWI